MTDSILRSESLCSSPLAPELRSKLVAYGAAVLAIAVEIYVFFPELPVSSRYFALQDFPVLVVGALALLAAARLSAPILEFTPTARFVRRAGFACAAFALAAALAGAVFALRRFDLVSDEVAANFDAAIFRAGHLLAPVDAQWRPFIDALNELALSAPGGAAWSSNYLPVNAALRSLADATLGAYWANPLLLAVATLALFSIALRLWPARPDAAFVACALFATSSQALVAAMTSFAMTGHLALNLVWLALFLRGSRLSHALALVVGFLACGLHQLVFHPLFVAPFILSLWFERKRALFCVHVGVYAAICLFWTEYWSLAQWLEGFSARDAAQSGAPLMVSRVARVFASSGFDAIFPMTLNLTRFLAWQNLFALPLAAFGVAAVRRGEGVARPLLLGMVVAVVAFGLLSPPQGAGWGYRYLHGFIGSWCLLAGYGWVEMSKQASRREQGAAMSALIAFCAASLFILAPLRVFTVAGELAPLRAAAARIETAPTEVVLIDRLHWLYGGGLTRNDPFLRAPRPKVMDLVSLDEAALRDLCAHHGVSMLTEAQGLALGVPYFETPAEWNEKRLAKLELLRSLSCAAPID